MLAHALAFPGGGVAGADQVRMGASRMPRWPARSAISASGISRLLVHVVGERLERRDVDDLGFVGELAGARGAHQTVEADEKCRQRFARAGGRGDQDIAAGCNFAGQPAICGSVGWPKRAANHSATRGSK